MDYMNIAASHYQNGEYKQALEFFEKAAPAHGFNAWYNAGVCHEHQRDYERALTSYHKALDLQPGHPSTLNNIGFALHELGRGREALDYVGKAYALSPENRHIGPNALSVWCNNAPMEEWPVLCQKILGNNNALPEHKYLASIYTACALWALKQERFPIEFPAPSQGYNWIKNIGVYQTHLQRLAEQKDESIYHDSKPVFMIGDSHVLSYAGLEFNGRKITPQLVFGAKAFHIASKAPNRYLTAFKTQTDRLEEDSTLLCCFGEIDCRIDEGMLAYQHKTSLNLKNIVEEQVARYIQAVKNIAPKTDVTFVNIPAPHPRLGDRREVIRLFNEQLSRQADIIDVYKASLGRDGYACEGSHIDDVHLKPAVFKRALLA